MSMAIFASTFGVEEVSVFVVYRLWLEVVHVEVSDFEDPNVVYFLHFSQSWWNENSKVKESRQGPENCMIVLMFHASLIVTRVIKLSVNTHCMITGFVKQEAGEK